MPAAEAAKDVYAPDLKVTRYTLKSGNFTVSNVGTKNSPSTGFDVLLYCKYFDDSTYKQIYHCNQVIAPGYSRSFSGAFQGSGEIKEGLIRVNPYKKFYECDYDNNARYFKLIKLNILSYTATEQSRYYGGDWWEYFYGYTFASGNSTTYNNGGYSPLISTNPIATGYNYYLGYWSRRHHWEWRNDPLYVNAVQFSKSFSEKYKIAYVAVSGVTNNSNMRVYADVGYAKFLTYNTTKSLWEGYIKYQSGESKNEIIIKVYSIRNGQNGTDDIMNYVSNVKIYASYMKNAWQWKY